MNIIFKLILLCLFDPSGAERLRENSNVLVPNNDVNLHAKLKTMLIGIDVDPEDFSKNEIASLSELSNSNIEKLRHKRVDSIRDSNVVFEYKNKNIEENQIDYETEVPEEVSSFALSDNESLDKASDSHGTSSSNLTTSEITTVKASYTTTVKTSHNTTTTAWPYNTTTTYKPFNFTSSSRSSAPWSTSSPNGAVTSTPFNNTIPTPAETSTITYKTTSVTNPVTPSNAPKNATSFSANETTIWDKTTTPLKVVSPTTPTLITEAPVSTTSEPIYDDLKSDECLLGKPERNLKWVNNEGSLNLENIIVEFGHVKHIDLSMKFRSSSMLDIYVNVTNCSIIAVSLMNTHSHVILAISEQNLINSCFISYQGLQ